ncbi:hypothetical protein [Fictibacillus phosphorivorans]|uniref:hypothetical protein n=1 Tax=Fictibacillus phosphorivorans TaxID=1221500 RepID=UPI002041FABB|nr:hypothetical protein [Fictibacillus phosphorivorans]MCM3718707.1 hypothetical protein [Fictibacillus phosphorivorans]MCM3776330.1 hypothetical protein [Fictibacillus phosphorivorans]
MKIQQPIVAGNTSIAQDILNGNHNLTTVDITNSLIQQSTIITPITIHINSVTDTIAGEGQGLVGGRTLTSGTNGPWLRRVAPPAYLTNRR